MTVFYSVDELCDCFILRTSCVFYSADELCDSFISWTSTA